MNSTFITSATKESEWPKSELPEVVVVGRSNVGKSSFINAFCNRKKLAYVGNTPGKTRLINFFDIDGSWVLVDVPGYGYAKMSKQQLIQMGKMMDEYFTKRKNLSAVVQLVDARHEPTGDDLDMVDFFRQMKLPIIVAATKIDKVPKTKRIRHLKAISQKLQIPLKNIIPISSTEKTGMLDVKAAIDQQLEIVSQKEAETKTEDE